MGSDESLLAVEIAGVLMNFVKPRRLGWVLGANGMLRIRPGRFRIPDVCFVSRQQCPNGRFSRGESIASLFPDLAVEVLSASNTREEMDEKLRDYFQAGARLVWYIDPASQSAEAFIAPDCRSAIPPNDMLTGDPVLPGFTVPLTALFDVDLTENMDA